MRTLIRAGRLLRFAVDGNRHAIVCTWPWFEKDQAAPCRQCDGTGWAMVHYTEAPKLCSSCRGTGVEGGGPWPESAL